MANKAAFQVIVLGPTGGPREDTVTGLLVRSTSTQWSLNSVVAVDAGTLLAGIIRTLELYITESKDGKGLMKEGPFVGLDLPARTARANAAYIFREIIGAVLLTHPHLDHLAGLAINTPMLEAGSGPKTLAALPSIVNAIKSHMFNDIIWPNLSDEDGGAGFITYQRLVEGGNPRFGLGETKGYVRACNGLLTKCLAVSHGRCKRHHLDTGKSQGSTVFTTDPLVVPSRAISLDHSEAGLYSPARSPRLYATNMKEPVWQAVESSAFFIRDYATGSEIIVFGDVEPDSVSLDPRNKRVWEVAAPKVAAGTLRAIFIECSYDDLVDDSSLYGHLCPRHLIAELTVLAHKVMNCQRQSVSTTTGKRRRINSTPVGEVSPKTKRISIHRERKSDASPGRASTRSGTRSRLNSGDYTGQTPDLVHDAPTPSLHDPVDGDDGDHGPDPNGSENIQWADPSPLPLAGLSVYIIHIKDTLTDGPPPSVQILQQLRSQGEAAGLGCEFYVPSAGEGIWI